MKSLSQIEDPDYRLASEIPDLHATSERNLQKITTRNTQDLTEALQMQLYEYVKATHEEAIVQENRKP